jgi:hypothetical protein
MGVLVNKEKEFKRCPQKGTVEIHTSFLDGKLYFRFVKHSTARFSGRDVSWLGEYSDIDEDNTVFKYLDFT